MATNPPDTVFRADAPFVTERIHAAAVSCSDGRLGEACDEFLADGLGLPRYDRLAVPGGAACLAGHFAARREGEAATGQLRFLVEAHELERVVLIAHEGCAFYLEQLRLPQLGLMERQFEDLRKAAATVAAFRRNLLVEAYFAHTGDGSVSFERVR
jgi:hypothetical protein